MPANNGFTQTGPDAQRFAEANAGCWESAMGYNAGGSGQFGSQMLDYDRCMEAAGWTRPNSVY